MKFIHIPLSVLMLFPSISVALDNQNNNPPKRQLLNSMDGYNPEIILEQLRNQKLAFNRINKLLNQKPQNHEVTSYREELKEASGVISSTEQVFQETDSDNHPIDNFTLYRTNETIRATKNPVWVLCSSIAWPTSDKNGWMDYINPLRENISKISASVGVFIRYYKDDESSSLIYGDHGATGFVIGQNYVMTNRHVLKNYAYKDNSGWHFIPNQELHIIFPQEYSRCDNRTTPRETKIIGIKDVGTYMNEDYAILEAEPNTLPPAVPLSKQFNLGFSARIAAVGYPQRPRPCQKNEIPRANDPCTFLTNPQIDALFIEPNKSKSDFPEFPAERISPGVILLNPTLGNENFSYDSSTWGGSSGSPIISLADGSVVGLHFEGIGGNIQNIGYNNAIKMETLIPKLVSSGIIQ